MRPQKIGIAALIALLTATSIPLPLNLPLLFRTPQALAQTTNARKAEADKLIEEGSALSLGQNWGGDRDYSNCNKP